LALQWVGQRLYLALAVKMICTEAGKFHTPLGWVVGARRRAVKFIKGAGLVVLGLAVTPGLETLIPALLIPLSLGGRRLPGWMAFRGQPCATIRDAGCVGGRGREWVGEGAI